MFEINRDLIKFVFAASLLLLTACSIKNDSSELLSISGNTMGTTYEVKFRADGSLNDLELNSLKGEIDSTLREVNRQMSTYIDTSEISKFNNYIGEGWFDISKDFAKVIGESKKIGELTNGALDITIGPLVNLWGFGQENRPRKVPSDEQITKVQNRIGLDKIEVSLNPPAVKKNIPKLYLDLSSTAKGFGVDKVFELLVEKGYNNFFVEIGGEIRAAGINHKNEIWKIGVADPNNPAKPQLAISIDNSAVATSGDYWNYFEEDGIRYSHTIDPRSGRPISHTLASVTVVSDYCLLADGLATAINVMGPDEGFNFASENNIAAYFIVRKDEGFEVKTTSEFEKYSDQ